MIPKLTIKEKIAFRYILNEKRVYQRWYGRYFVFGMDYGRLRRVVSRIPTWFQWCSEWAKEGRRLEESAEQALSRRNMALALRPPAEK